MLLAVVFATPVRLYKPKTPILNDQLEQILATHIINYISIFYSDYLILSWANWAKLGIDSSHLSGFGAITTLIPAEPTSGRDRAHPLYLDMHIHASPDAAAIPYPARSAPPSSCASASAMEGTQTLRGKLTITIKQKRYYCNCIYQAYYNVSDSKST